MIVNGVIKGRVSAPGKRVYNFKCPILVGVRMNVFGVGLMPMDECIDDWALL